MSRLPTDQAERDLAIRWTDGPVLVEAGAGTGKTHLLVQRILHLLRTQDVRLGQIAAITFTVKAAAELRGRVRAGLADALSKDGLNPDERGRFREAMEEIDRAPISTIHSFAMGLLRERPMAAGLGPGAGDVDMPGYEELRDRLWREWLGERLTKGDPALELFLVLGFGLRDLEMVRNAMLDSPELREGFPKAEGKSLHEIKASIIEAFERWKAFGEANCPDPADKGFAQIAGVEDWVMNLSDDGVPDLQRVIWNDAPKLNGRLGSTKVWGGVETRRAFYDLYKQFLAEAADAAGGEILGGVVSSLMNFVERLERAVREEGILDYQSILYFTAKLLREDAEVREYFHGRYRFFLVDEFQDTDPLQVELIFSLAADEYAPGEWEGVKLGGGKLFLVGDPKQSIYRFRRADIAIYHRVKEIVEKAPDSRVITISQNFRSAPGVTEWVNGVFSRVIRKNASIQPEYSPLQAFREEKGPRVRILTDPGLENGEKDTADERRKREAACLAGAIKKMVEEEQPVIAPKAGVERPLRYGDIAILFRTRTAHADFEEAFRRLDISVSSEGGRGFYETIEVAAAGAVLRAVIHPGDPLALAAALRSPLYGFSDVDLARWRIYPPGDPRHPEKLAEAVEEIREMHERRNGRSARGVMEEIFRRTQAHALFLSAFYGEQRVANLLKLLDVAFEYERGGVRGVDEFGAFLGRQLKQGKEAQEAEAGLTDGDEDHVRFMTIHAAKGLEFPAVAMVDLSGGERNDPPASIADRAGGRLFLNVGRDSRRLRTSGFGAALEHEKEIEEAERKRLLYVAATRARDFLIWPAFTGGGAWKALEEVGAGAEAMREGALGPVKVLAGERPEGVAEIQYLRFRDGVFEVDEAQVNRAERAWDEKEKELAVLRGADGPAGFLAPSRLVDFADGEEGHPRPEDEEGERRGISDLESGGEARGKKFGAFVHELLARLEPPTPHTAEKMAAHAVLLALGRKLSEKDGEEALGLIRRVAGGELLRRAAASPRRYRELPFLMEIEGRAVRGTADLVFEEGGGLVIVDFKTDAVQTGEAAGRAEKYAHQGMAYAVGLEAASGKTVREVVFAFLRPGVDLSLPIDEGAREGLRRAVRDAV